MSRLRTPPDSHSTSTETSQSSKKHQLRHRSPRGQRGRPRAGPGSPPPSSSTTATTTVQSHHDGSTTRHRQRDRSNQVVPQPGPWDWAWKYRRELAGAAIAIVLVLVISAIRISLHTADYAPGAVYSPIPKASRAPHNVRNKPGPSSLTSTIPYELLGTSHKRGEGAREEKVGNEEADEKVLHEALDSAVRHALEDAWQLPPHAPASDHAAPAANAQDPATAGGGDSIPRQRTLAELYAELEDLGISPHELNEVLDEAMRSSGDR